MAPEHSHGDARCARLRAAQYEQDRQSRTDLEKTHQGKQPPWYSMSRHVGEKGRRTRELCDAGGNEEQRNERAAE